MQRYAVKTFTAQIYIAGYITHASQIVRRYCMTGLCVTIEPLDYIYTGGREAGMRIGLINYPRFPSDSTKILETAIDLANVLRDELSQHSWCIVTPDQTIWDSSRKSDSTL